MYGSKVERDFFTNSLPPNRSTHIEQVFFFYLFISYADALPNKTTQIILECLILSRYSYLSNLVRIPALFMSQYVQQKNKTNQVLYFQYHAALLSSNLHSFQTKKAHSRHSSEFWRVKKQGFFAKGVFRKSVLNGWQTNQTGGPRYIQNPCFKDILSVDIVSIFKSDWGRSKPHL